MKIYKDLHEASIFRIAMKLPQDVQSQFGPRPLWKSDGWNGRFYLRRATCACYKPRLAMNNYVPNLFVESRRPDVIGAFLLDFDKPIVTFVRQLYDAALLLRPREALGKYSHRAH